MAYAFPTSSFVLDIVGDNTGEKFTGNFEFKQRLSHRDQLLKDSQRRSLLGDKPDMATQDSKIRAEMLSHLGVSIVEAPKFWKDAGGGIDLYDDNVLIAVFERTVEEQSRVAEETIKKGEEAKVELKKEAKKKKTDAEE